ncbi:hypothetical protein J5J83_05910 [Azoarcus sp. L1K30]|uniref:type II restriction endonuclease n=1 Tax=Azoarcus sp. L1K30 TaxID=2820277 RepID=UPI001B81D826|nr:type II restriction endonuclease [Azoarcus sp. L1K30]MBR0565652.1 hypothetical protein [Azoarcus sp. L1K30]
MKKGYLSEYFTDVAYKRLSAVEALRHRSNQHEFDGVGGLKRMLGTARREFPAMFIYLSDNEAGAVMEAGFLTWYDAREAHPVRSEYRLYYPDTKVSERADERDLLVIGRRPDDSLVVIIAAAGSTAENQVAWLFGVTDLDFGGYAVKTEKEADRMRLVFASRQVLELIGVEVEEQAPDFLGLMLDRFGGVLPKTREFSAFSRETLRDVALGDDPDRILMAWMEQEEILFRTLERHLIGDRLKQGFADDVDAFITFSLSVQNRRKSRAGSALENHLEFLFTARGIRHSRTAITEGKARPDFLFPGHAEYHDPAWSAVRLTMLGVKSSCKDRWRQILAEADRIPDKHLLTLEPGISRNQTDEMQAKGVRLVLPRAIHDSYLPEQQTWLMDVAGFIELVEERQ